MVSFGSPFALERRDQIVVAARSSDILVADPGRASYYLLTLLLQLSPGSIAGGMGVQLGVDAWRAVRRPRPDTWLGFPLGRLRDVALSYIVVVPLFFVASMWEFVIG